VKIRVYPRLFFYPMSKGNLFIISSPSGGGKGTLIRRVLEIVPKIGYSVSFTTRAPREGEIDGKHYNFISPAKFEKLIAEDEFLEYAQVHGNYYGTSRSQVERETAAGIDIILEIDVQGADLVKSAVLDAVSVFIMPPSFEVLKTRLERRATEGMADLQLRLGNARGEVERYSDFDYVIINDEVEQAVKELGAIILAERVKRNKQEENIKEVIKTF
jgi:guanylate kinase